MGRNAPLYGHATRLHRFDTVGELYEQRHRLLGVREPRAGFLGGNGHRQRHRSEADRHDAARLLVVHRGRERLSRSDARRRPENGRSQFRHFQLGELHPIYRSSWRLMPRGRRPVALLRWRLRRLQRRFQSVDAHAVAQLHRHGGRVDRRLAGDHHEHAKHHGLDRHGQYRLRVDSVGGQWRAHRAGQLDFTRAARRFYSRFHDPRREIRPFDNQGHIEWQASQSPGGRSHFSGRQPSGPMGVLDASERHDTGDSRQHDR